MKTEHKVIGGVLGLTLIIMVGGVWFSDKKGIENSEKLSRPLMGEKMADEGAMHVARDKSHVAYLSNPPTSGPHWVGTAGPGIKTEPIPDELILHSMEHGAVIVWYKESLSQGNVDIIKEAFQSAS